MADFLKDFPSELKQFGRMLNFRYKYRASDLFCDWVEYLAGGMLLEGDKSLAERLQKTYKEDYEVFQKLNREWITVMAEMVKDDGSWYDLLGSVYEAIGNGNERLGQFFTPPCVVDMMVKIVYGHDVNKARISDPCSGSGRFVIALQAHCPGNDFYTCDIDPICTKMTAINMAIHGCSGQAICGNSLWLENDWRFGYQINPYKSISPIPHLSPLSKEKCLQFQMLKSAKVVEKVPEIAKEKIIIEPEIKVSKHGQLSFF